MRTNPLFRAKNAVSWDDHSVIRIPALRMSPPQSASGHHLCPVRALYYYRKRTEGIRGNLSALFVLFPIGETYDGGDNRYPIRLV